MMKDVLISQLYGLNWKTAYDKVMVENSSWQRLLEVLLGNKIHINTSGP